MKEDREAIFWIVLLIGLGTGIGLARHLSFLASLGIAWLSFIVWLLVEVIVRKWHSKKLIERKR